MRVTSAPVSSLKLMPGCLRLRANGFEVSHIVVISLCDLRHPFADSEALSAEVTFFLAGMTNSLLGWAEILCKCSASTCTICTYPAGFFVVGCNGFYC